jgi:CheY-like chemotaxis protein
MLTFSRGRDIRAEVIEPMSVLQETLKMMHSILPASIRLITNYQDFDSRIKIDPVQLQQVLINLVVNARDAIPNSKGSITISTELRENIEARCTSCNNTFTGDYLCLSIEDDGLGITRDHIAKIFDPFFTTKEVGKGTGMGLSVVHGIIHGVDGHIIVTSKLNQGTRIELLFAITTEPLPETNQDFELPDIITPLADTKGKVLIIDDEPTITQLYDDVLESKQINCIIFNEPELALDYYTQNMNDIAVVVSDYTMPRMNGTDLIKAIRRHNDEVPIILCSGNADVIDRTIFDELKINHFLTKPIDLTNLAVIIMKYL